MPKKLSEYYFGKKPLNKFRSSSYSRSLELYYNKFEPPKEIELVDTWICKPIENKVTMVFACGGQEEKLVTYDFLHCNDGEAFVVHKRVLEKLTEICPNDFEVIPVIIKNLKPKQTAFANQDFVLINMLHEIDAIDKEETTIEYSSTGFVWTKNVQFKENCMAGHLLARDSFKRTHLLFDPKLAREFANSKVVRFVDRGY
ncbi:MAG: hypothetical protein EOP33_02825 [Rickettsiaceae bacterium]|nr:MAG: hypothetical protein EOP33_02825 [Rickettsiaceae bacterium]